MKNLKLNQFKIGAGPMSTEIIDILVNYSTTNSLPMMIIASRNQIDHRSGYVTTTADFLSKNTNDDILFCRDHCGPYFSAADKGMSIADAIRSTKDTIEQDILHGMDLIHIDTCYCDDPYGVAEELIEFTTNLNPNILLEFGSEENTGDLPALEKFKNDAAFASQFKNIKFIVGQTGSLVMGGKQSGSFDIDYVKQLVKVAHNHGLQFKEHNADYLQHADIQLRKEAGINALNIAPQLGHIQTETILDLCDTFGIDSTAFECCVLESNTWEKWTRGVSCDDREKVHIAGHYCFNTPIYKDMKEKLRAHVDVDAAIDLAITSCLDTYYVKEDEEARLKRKLAEIRKRDPFIYR